MKEVLQEGKKQMVFFFADEELRCTSSSADMVAYEEEFVEDLLDQCFKVRVDMERRSLMIIELEGLGVALDCIDRLRAMQKSDTKKLVSLRRMLLEARDEAHERQLVCDSMDDND
ncbi:hypothetical protein Tco_0927340 [Tanacetum coccineum]